MEKRLRVVITEAINDAPLTVAKIYLGSVEIGELKLRHTHRKARNFLELLKDGFELEDRTEEAGDDNAK